MNDGCLHGDGRIVRVGIMMGMMVEIVSKFFVRMIVFGGRKLVESLFESGNKGFIVSVSIVVDENMSRLHHAFS